MIRRSWTQTASIEETLGLWAASLREVKKRIRPLFGQERVARNAGLFLEGLLGDEQRKTGWMRAEAAGDPGPWRQQAILGRRDWDADALRDIVRDYVIEHLADDDAVLVIDETGFLKQGNPPSPKKRNVAHQQNPKHNHAATDPLVNAGNPSHCHQTRSKAHSTRAHHRMVLLAQSPPGCRPTSSLQIKKTAVMLSVGLLLTRRTEPRGICLEQARYRGTPCTTAAKAVGHFRYLAQRSLLPL